MTVLFDDERAIISCYDSILENMQYNTVFDALTQLNHQKSKTFSFKEL